jgi:hypothetical protein
LFVGKLHHTPHAHTVLIEAMETKAAASAAAGAKVNPTEEEGGQTKNEILTNLVEKKRRARKELEMYSKQIADIRQLGGGVSEQNGPPNLEKRKQGAAETLKEAGADLREDSHEMIADLKRENEKLTADSNMLKQLNGQLGHYNKALNGAIKTMKFCHHCGKDNSDLKRCTKCLVALYCDRKCQKKHHPKHINWCRAMSETDITSMNEALSTLTLENLKVQVDTMKKDSELEKTKLQESVADAETRATLQLKEAKKWHSELMKQKKQNELLASENEELKEGPGEGEKSFVECLICQECAPTMAYIPCWHRCTCEGCCGLVTKCPSCRADVQGVQRIYG